MANGFFGTKESFFTPPQSPIRRTICQKSPIFAAGRIRVREQKDSGSAESPLPGFRRCGNLFVRADRYFCSCSTSRRAQLPEQRPDVSEQSACCIASRVSCTAQFDAAALHLLVGRDFRIDMMAFEHERERHSPATKSATAATAHRDDDPVGHNEFNLKSFPTPT